MEQVCGRWTEKKNVITSLQEMLHQNHAYVSTIKYTLEHIELPDHKVTIRAGKRSVRQHERCYNAAAVDEVAIIHLNKQHRSRIMS